MTGRTAFGRRLRRFLTDELWASDLRSISGVRSLVVRILRVGALVLRGFREDALSVHAAALTFNILMSLVPMLAIGFAMLKGLGAAPETVARIRLAVADMPEGFRGFIEVIIGAVMNTTLITVGWIGVIVLFVTAIQTLSSIENAFNAVWGVERPRAWWRRITNYTTMTVLVPLLIMAAFGVHAGLRHPDVLKRLGEAAPAYLALLKLSPLLAVWAAFALLIIFMPNTRVHRAPAILSAFLAAAIWIFWQKIYLGLQIGIAKYNTIYGTFASVPIFLLWVYVGCTIILFGAELAFALQNHATFAREQAVHRASAQARTLLALSLLSEAAIGHRKGCWLDAPAFAETHLYPIRLVNEVLRVLANERLIAGVAGQEGGYLLARDPATIAVREVVEIVGRQGAGPEELGLTPLAARWKRLLEEGGGRSHLADLIETA